MKKIIKTCMSLILVGVISTLTATDVSAQDILNEDKNSVYKKELTLNKIVKQYTPLREADVMWSRKIWREIDLREKMNHPFYYPENDGEANTTGDRKSLIDVIYSAINEGSITAYGNAIMDDEFREPMTQEEIKVIGGAEEKYIEVTDWDAVAAGADPEEVTVQRLSKKQFDRNTVKKWRLKEEWFFDKQYSSMQVRILGLAPLQEDRDEVTANDGIYGAIINNCSNSIDYYLYADNNSQGVFSPKRAAYEFYSISTTIPQSSLVINEVMSNNKTIVTDETGDYDDWIELYNTTNTPISTNGLIFSDNLLNLAKWDLPNAVVNPNSYFIIWADEDGNTGDNHANFKLSNLGEQLILSNSDSTVVDAEFIYAQLDDIAYGRSPNGTGNFSMLTPTFKRNNTPTSIDDFSDQQNILFFPNPFSNFIKIEKEKHWYITNTIGQIIYTSNKSSTINTSLWKSGVYFLHFTNSIHKSVKLLKVK